MEGIADVPSEKKDERRAGMKRPELSVIIIGRNEARHIDRCIRSVLKGTDSVPGREILYVDSASEDGTIGIARRHLIDIVQLRKEWPLSAAAGRYIGFQLTGGRNLFFIDGDSLLFKSWIPLAIEELRRDSRVAGLAGVVHEIWEDGNGKVVGLQKNRYEQKAFDSETRTLGGIGMYKREILEEVGSFNPYLNVDEERELGLRIRRAGYCMKRMNSPMALTHSFQRETLQEIVRRSQSKLYHFGATLKYCRQNRFSGQYIRERLFFIVQFVAAAAAALILLAVLVLSHHALFIPIGVLAAVGILFLVKRNKAGSILTSLVKRTLITARTFQSYFQTKVLPPESYPREAIRIQSARGREAV
jgi:glycosyltransferase involved in cell wall biosynthesis